MIIDTKVYENLYTLISQLHEQKASLTEPLKTSLSELINTSKEIGTALFHQERFEEAEFYLTFPGLAGEAEAQYAMATCTGYQLGAFRYPFARTVGWLRLAAAQDHVLALMWLGDTQSLAKAKALSTEGAAQGDIQSMFNLYTLTQDITWLTKAADTGNPRALYKLAQTYQKHPGLMPDALERTATIEALCTRAADSGYPWALADRLFSPTSNATMVEKQRRLAQLAWTGDQNGLLEYGYALAALPRDNTKPARTYGMDRDLPKAYAALKFEWDRTATTRPVPGLEEAIDFISHQMNVDEHDAALASQSELKSKIASSVKYHEPKVVVGYSPY
ncbi:sel1 repeat family protein [Pseudomonas fluorescens]|uniref:sel1 repeat family protein n=1 Tax=Pseudomonas fluorescens TaxID=294 RepID=UPI001785E9B3|nr:sel1 repeat family protein [Pseudomonas fluorescens]MBD8151227.1 sel1 repeat family protein [Pseudomonas fluorescens]MBD8179242.1 sel1 repeat family protein [Pseudomonas fluorescens]MBD8746509.1 sel1 repeat family protein [Pseudomonas fluorescens]MBD8749726.1 sel1 repeat family protein [Pseudomonas fluorescens]MBD8758767.1 sel1 repeat family protein [Pseudomonas fluorescens]